MGVSDDKTSTGVSDEKIETLSDEEAVSRIASLKIATDAAVEAYSQLRLGKDAVAEYEKAKAKSDEAEKTLAIAKQKIIDFDSEMLLQKNALSEQHSIKLAEASEKMAATLVECERIMSEAKVTADAIVSDARKKSSDLILEKKSVIDELNAELVSVKEDKKSIKLDLDAAKKAKDESDLLISYNKELKLLLESAVLKIKEAVAEL